MMHGLPFYSRTRGKTPEKLVASYFARVLWSAAIDRRFRARNKAAIKRRTPKGDTTGNVRSGPFKKSALDNEDILS
jgi:hypothetical protein